MRVPARLSSFAEISLGISELFAFGAKCSTPFHCNEQDSDGLSCNLSIAVTQSLDLVTELVRLGPLAMPVCLQQGYRLPAQKEAYKEILQALTQLASSNLGIL